MIGMFVGNDDGIKVVDGFFDGGQSRKGFTFTEAGVDKDAGAFAFQKR